jgi:hypothetical protein
LDKEKLKERFVKSIEALQSYNDWYSLMVHLGIEFSDNNQATRPANELVLLLEEFFEDDKGLIEWWCFETSFGRDSNVNERDGHAIDTAEKLYDLLGPSWQMVTPN